MNPFDKLLTDTINIEKPNGKQFNNIKAKVRDKDITIHNVRLLVENEDIISRKLPNGSIEKFKVIDVNYRKGIKIIPSKYIIKYTKLL